MEYHEAANIFPLVKEDIPALAKDIKASGLICPIELLGGKILDGRRRFLACKGAGVEPKFRDVDEYVDDPVQYVNSLNLHRRHLTPSQKAMAAAKASVLWKKCKDEAAERRKRKPANLVKVARPEQTSMQYEETEPDISDKSEKPKRAQYTFEVFGQQIDVI